MGTIKAAAMFAVMGVLSLTLAGVASAIPPVLTSVGQQDRHPTARFSAPYTSYGEIEIATNPARATSGGFLSENHTTSDFLDSAELAGGSWFYERQLDPGAYFILFDVTSSFDSCYLSGGGTNPACADGYSAVVSLTIPMPRIKYSTKAHVEPGFLGLTPRTLSLELKAKPLGVKRSYKLCFKKAKRKKCKKSSISGYDWNSSASDEISDISLKGLGKKTKFTWYVGGKRVASRTVKR